MVQKQVIFLNSNYVFFSYSLIFIVMLLSSQTYAQITLIPNPDNADQSDIYGLVEHNGNFYFDYYDANQKIRLAKYDGNSITLIANPDSRDKSFTQFPIIYNGNLYFQYVYANSSYGKSLAKYDGKTVSIAVAAKDNWDEGFTGYPIVYNGSLYFQYTANKSYQHQLAKYDGNSLTIIDNLKKNDYGFRGSPMVYNGNLYFFYEDWNRRRLLAKYDGNSIILINNPTYNDKGFTDSPIVYKDNLYFRYCVSGNKQQLAKYDGSTITLIANPNLNDVGISDNPIIYDGNLYFQYTNAGGKQQLAKYDGNTITLIANPNLNDKGILHRPTFYNGNLYFQYTNAGGKRQLAKYDGNTITFISQQKIENDYELVDICDVFDGNLYLKYKDFMGYYLAKYDGTNICLFYNPEPNPNFDEGVGWARNFSTSNKLLLSYNTKKKGGLDDRFKKYQLAYINPCVIPFTYTLSGNSDTAIRLSNSQKGVYYQLKNGEMDVDKEIEGTGEALSFGIKGVGNYTVVARNGKNNCCFSLMTGNVKILK